MKEKDLINSIRKYLKTIPGVFFWKEHGGQYGTAGIPDIICCYRGRFVALEAKTDTGNVTKLQEITLRQITEAGGIAAVVRSVDDVKRIIT